MPHTQMDTREDLVINRTSSSSTAHIRKKQNGKTGPVSDSYPVRETILSRAPSYLSSRVVAGGQPEADIREGLLTEARLISLQLQSSRLANSQAQLAGWAGQTCIHATMKSHTSTVLGPTDVRGPSNRTQKASAQGQKEMSPLWTVIFSLETWPEKPGITATGHEEVCRADIP